jgi:hypothetical protein
MMASLQDYTLSTQKTALLTGTSMKSQELMKYDQFHICFKNSNNSLCDFSFQVCSFDVSVVSSIPIKHCGSSVQRAQNTSPSSRRASPSASIIPTPKERKVIVPEIGMAMQVNCAKYPSYLVFSKDKSRI